jgi:hypothetical protein
VRDKVPGSCSSVRRSTQRLGPMRYFVLLLIVISSAACSRNEEASATVRVSNLNIGLMRQDGAGKWRIYSPGNRFPLISNGPCVVAKKPQTCMWYGFEFDYTTSTAREILMCRAKFNKPTDMITAEKVEAPDADDATFAIPLLEHAGHYAQSANVFPKPDDTSAPWTVDISCKHNAREVIHFTFTALHEA